MDHNVYKILIVDDEPDILEFLSYNLKKEGFQIFTSSNGKSALELACKVQPHLILLDIMMPEMDGIETCERIREIPQIKNCIVAFLTARTEDYSQIAGFEAGGDDYIAKPIRPKLLVGRINALLKRIDQASNHHQTQAQTSVFGNLEIDEEKFLIYIDGSELYLPKKEFYILKLLTSKPSKVFTRDEIYENIWGNETFVGDRTLDVYIRKLREKIGDDSIKTIKGVGYKFEIVK